MDKKLLASLITIRIIHIILAILVAAIVSGLIALITALITEDIEIIVVSCLIGVWIAEIILYIARNRILYKKRIKVINGDDSTIIKKKNILKKIYIVSTIIFSIVFGFIIYNVKDNILNNITGINNNHHETVTNDQTLLIKLGIVFVLLIVLAIRIVIRKRFKKRIEKGSWGLRIYKKVIQCTSIIKNLNKKVLPNIAI